MGPKKLGLEVVAVGLKKLGLDDVHGLDNVHGLDDVHGLEVVVEQKRTRQDGRLVGDETVVAERETVDEIEVQKQFLMNESTGHRRRGQEGDPESDEGMP